MRPIESSSWMWGDALTLLEQAERLQRQFCGGGPLGDRCWEPPIDVLETEDAVTIYVALPGVPRSGVVVTFEPGGVMIAGVRRLPAPRAARIHRLEIPYGRFERHVRFPLYALEPTAPELVDGCLILTLMKVKESP